MNKIFLRTWNFHRHPTMIEAHKMRQIRRVWLRLLQNQASNEPNLETVSDQEPLYSNLVLSKQFVFITI